MQPIKILFLSSEITPLIKVGGLADVTGALPPALRKKGVDIRIAVPYYEKIKKNKHIKTTKILNNLKIHEKEKNSQINIYKTLVQKTPLYLVENNRYLSKGSVYENPRAKLQSFAQIERFMFFSQAILKSLKAINFVPDIIHFNDWFFGAIPALLKTNYAQDIDGSKIKTILTIHNLLVSQGQWHPRDIFNFLGLKGNEHPLLKKRDYQKNFNLIQQAILGADLINTVSPTYSKEILTQEFGGNLAGLLKKRKKDLYGILNGLDTKLFGASTNPHIKKNFSIKNLNDKTTNKLHLQKITRLKVDKNIPIIASIGRLAWQKGSDLIQQIVPSLDKTNCQFILLATGDPRYEKGLNQLSKKYSKWFKAVIKFDAVLQYQIYAGADMFVVPSKYEPCGLSQMISMDNATIPIVRATGGLNDTVINYQPPIRKRHTGFVFKKIDADQFLTTIKRALKVYAQEPRVWTQLQKNGMCLDFSWHNSAKKYLKLYKKLLKK